MNRAIGLLILLIILIASCPGKGPITPTHHPGGEHDPNAFCIDFETESAIGAVNGSNAALIYNHLGIAMPSNPVITNNGALCEKFQCLYQGDPGSARPEASCGPIEVLIDPGLEVGEVKFEARNVGFISIPVEIVATAFGEQDGAEVQVDEFRIVSMSTLGDLRPVEIVTVESQALSDPPITKLVVNYGTCPPHVVIDNLCFKPKPRAVGAIGQSDSGAERLVYYFDNRERKSYFQLANLSSQMVDVHVQVWIVNSTIHACEEINFDDTYTPKDVHTYDTLNLIRNNGDPLGFSGDHLSGKYGFVVISKSDGPPNPLVGSMRIIDNAGYEYKTNAVAPESVNTNTERFGAVNFNAAGGNSFSELIGFTYAVIDDDTVYASPAISTVFGSPFDSLLVFDSAENAISCSPKQFSCEGGNTNIGLDYSLPNSRDPDNITCPTTLISATNNAGWMQLPFANTVCTDPAVTDAEGNCMYDTHFVGFFGLNNGTSSGVFDSWWGGELSDEE